MSEQQQTMQMAKVHRDSLSALTDQLGLTDPQEVYNIIATTVMPGKSSYEQLGAFCLVASTYHLNPLVREIFAFPNKQGGITPMVSIDGWLKLLNNNPDFDGLEHVYGKDDDDSWVECRIFSKSRPNHPTVAREFLSENMMKSSPVWQQRPKRMLKHRATIQAIRYFGGYSGLADMEEMQEMRDVTPKAKENSWLGKGEANDAPTPPEPTAKKEEKKAAKAADVVEVAAKVSTQGHDVVREPKPDEIPGLGFPPAAAQAAMSADEFPFGEVC